MDYVCVLISKATSPHSDQNTHLPLIPLKSLLRHKEVKMRLTNLKSQPYHSDDLKRISSAHVDSESNMPLTARLEQTSVQN